MDETILSVRVQRQPLTAPSLSHLLKKKMRFPFGLDLGLFASLLFVSSLATAQAQDDDSNSDSEQEIASIEVSESPALQSVNQAVPVPAATPIMPNQPVPTPLSEIEPEPVYLNE